jgi:hypothetical protein
VIGDFGRNGTRGGRFLPQPGIAERAQASPLTEPSPDWLHPYWAPQENVPAYWAPQENVVAYWAPQENVVAYWAPQENAAPRDHVENLSHTAKAPLPGRLARHLSSDVAAPVLGCVC